MSRTYRKTKLNKSYRKYYDMYNKHTFNYIVTDCLTIIKVYMIKNSYEYNMEVNKFHREDGGYSRTKEPGPSHFRTLTSERPFRRYNKLEIHKYILDNEREPNIIAKGKLQYWT